MYLKNMRFTRKLGDEQMIAASIVWATVAIAVTMSGSSGAVVTTPATGDM